MRRLLFLAGVLTLVAGRAAAQQLPVAACCAVTGIDTGTALISARVSASGGVFQFRVTDRRVLATLRVGQPVYADFAKREVSLDGRRTCCTITSGPQAAGARPGAGVAIATRPAPSLPPPPSIAYGPPHPATSARVSTPARWEARTVTTTRAGRTVSAPVLHLRGLDGIEQAAGIPDGVRRLLEIHVRTLRPGEPDHYIVNTQLAQQWVAAHPVPADIKPSDAGGDDHSGCDAFSMHCAGEAAEHAAGQVSSEWQKLWEQAVKDWDHATTELSHELNASQECFADHTLPLPDIPVQFSITPGMTIDVKQSGSKTLPGGGSASGTVQGSVGLGFPMQSNFKAELDLFYIPCLPFVVRPRSLAGDGTLTVGERLTVGVSATGKFDKVFTIPPTGGPQIPIEVIPILIGEVPVAELDVSAYIEGNVEVGGAGKAEAHFQLDNPHKAAFEFSCDGTGCRLPRLASVPDPTTTSENAQIQGQVFVKPAIYTALQLDFDIDALSARAGPQPYLLGTASGCAAGTATQTAGGPSGSQENHALTADLDWGVDLRAEALIARQVIGRPYVHSVTGDKHLWFRDLAPGGSTALVAVVDATAQATVSQAAVYKVRMPSCYPYTNPVQYRVTWTGNASPAPAAACQWQAGQGTCTYDPTKDLAIALTWPAAGSYALSVVPVGDDHHRTFQPAPPVTRLAITVGAAP